MSERIDHVRALVDAGPYASVDSIVYVEALRQVIEALDAARADAERLSVECWNLEEEAKRTRARYAAVSDGVGIWAKRAEAAETKLGRVVATCERAGQHYNTCTGAAGELRSRILYSAT